MVKHEKPQIAYANILLNDFDRAFIHKRMLDSHEQNSKYRLIFELILERKFNSDEFQNNPIQNTTGSTIDYDLTFRLINHLNFIDKLISLFKHFQIDLISLAEISGVNLYVFAENRQSIKSDFVDGPDKNTLEMEDDKINYQINILPKFETSHLDDCLVLIMQYLIQKNKLEKTNSDLWLYWFNRKYIKVPAPLIWKGSSTLLSNVIQHLCGESNSTTIKTAFCTHNYVKPTRKIYELSKLYHCCPVKNKFRTKKIGVSPKRFP